MVTMMRTPEPVHWRDDGAVGYDETYAESPSVSRSYNAREVDPVVRGPNVTAEPRARVIRPQLRSRAPIVSFLLLSEDAIQELSSRHPPDRAEHALTLPPPAGRRGYPEPLRGNRSRRGWPRRRSHAASLAQGAQSSARREEINPVTTHAIWRIARKKRRRFWLLAKVCVGNSSPDCSRVLQLLATITHSSSFLFYFPRRRTKLFSRSTAYPPRRTRTTTGSS